jgi:transposase
MLSKRAQECKRPWTARERAGASWRDLPGRYGPWTTCHERYVNRLKQWMTLGLLGQVDAVGTRNNALR